MTAFQLDLKIKNFEKLTQLPKIIEASVKKWEVLDGKMKAIDNATAGIVKNLKLHEASALRIALVQQKASLAKFFEMAKNPMALVSKGFSMLILQAGLLLKTLGIGLIISALTTIGFLVGFILKTLFRFNVGGIGTQFARVAAIISIVLNKAIISFVNLIKQFDPILKPFFKFMGDSIVNIVKKIGDWASGLGKNAKLISLLKNYFLAIIDYIKVMVGITKQFWENVGGTGNATQGMLKTFTSLFYITYQISTVFLKFYTLVMKVISALGIFKALGLTFKFIFEPLMFYLEKVLEVINWIIEGVSRIMDMYSAMTNKTIATATPSTSTSNQSTNNNNISFVSPTPINSDSANRLYSAIVSQINMGGYK